MYLLSSHHKAKLKSIFVEENFLFLKNVTDNLHQAKINQTFGREKYITIYLFFIFSKLLH